MAGRGGLLVSEVPGSIQPLQWAPQDVVEIERAKALKTDICNVFGVPDAKLERNAANLAAAKTADYAHTKDAGVPRCVRNEETLNVRLVPLFDDSGRLFLAYDSPVREDEIFTLEQTRTASITGAMTRNEVRAAVGLDPVQWGEQPLVPSNMVEVDARTGKPIADAAENPAPAPVSKQQDPLPGENALESLASGQQALAEGQARLAAAFEKLAQRIEPSAVFPHDMANLPSIVNASDATDIASDSKVAMTDTVKLPESLVDSIRKSSIHET